MYVCNCNGIRDSEVRAAIAAGASRPHEIYSSCDTEIQCGRCVTDMIRMLAEQRQALSHAAE